MTSTFCVMDNRLQVSLETETLLARAECMARRARRGSRGAAPIYPEKATYMRQPFAG